MQINLASGVDIDAQSVVTGRGCVIGQSGSGKSYLVGVIVEELCKNGLPFLIVDTEGEYKSLKSVFKLIWAGDDRNADVGLDTDYQKLFSQSIDNRVPVILDVSDAMDKTAEVYRALEALYKVEEEKRAPFLVVIEEADKFCLSADTEILSRDGWKTYKELNEGEEVLTLDTASGFMEYNRIRRIITRRHIGKLNRIKTRTGLDMLTTVDHRHLIQTFDHGKYGRWHWKDFEFRPLAQCPSAFRIPVASNFKKKLVGRLPEPLLQLIGWILTDGNWNESEKKSIRITQSKPEGIKKIKTLLDLLDFKYTQNTRKRLRSHTLKDGRVIRDRYPSSDFYISRKDSAKIKNLLGEQIHRIPKTLMQLDAESLRHIYEGMMDGDGTRAHYKTRVSRQGRFRANCLYCMKEGLADDFQELCTKIGIRSRKSTTRIFVSERYPWHYVRKSDITKVDYDGIVWDITVPNGNFVARRKGAIFITGNCPQIVHPKANPVEEISVRGRKRGIGLLVATQRPANVSKNVLAQCSYGFVGKLSIDNDLQAVSVLFSDRSTLGKITKLSTGTFMPFGLQFKDPVKVKKREVLHVGSTPSIESYKQKDVKMESILKDIRGVHTPMPKQLETKPTRSVESSVVAGEITIEAANELAKRFLKKQLLPLGAKEFVAAVQPKYFEVTLCNMRIPTGRRNEYTDNYVMVRDRNFISLKKGLVFERSETVNPSKFREMRGNVPVERAKIDQNAIVNHDPSGVKAAKRLLMMLYPDGEIVDAINLYIPIYEITLRQDHKVRVFKIDAVFGKKIEGP